MRDIPCFTCPAGVATLLLGDVAVHRRAYALVRGVFTTMEALLQECAQFCRAVGAEWLYCSGEGDFSAYPVHARLIARRLPCAALPETACEARPTRKDAWLELYNRRFADVPAARHYDRLPEGAYFVYDGAECIGLGLLQDGVLAAVASLAPGRGEACVCALARHLEGDVELLCAEENTRAMALYDRLGFSRGEIREIWYKVPL